MNAWIFYLMLALAPLGNLGNQDDNLNQVCSSINESAII